MKPIHILWCATLLFVGSCAGVPTMKPLKTLNTQVVEGECNKAFPSGRWRFVHSITIKMPDDRQGVVLGVTVISSEAKTIDCVIMSVEGFVFFDARMDGDLTIHRAVPPFDNKEFAQGLMRDIRLIFFEPQAASLKSGLSDDGFPVCRYRITDGRVEDVITFPDNSWEIQQYDKSRHLTRTVNGSNLKDFAPVVRSLIPQMLKLRAYGKQSYELTMKLVEAECLSKKPVNPEPPDF